MTDKKNWLQLLAYVTGSINQELLVRNEYLAAENHILKSQIKGRLRLSDGERATLAGIAKLLARLNVLGVFVGAFSCAALKSTTARTGSSLFA
jgi:hypothetical protein